MGQSGEDAPPPTTLADRLNHLFEVVHPGHRGPYTNEEVAAAITARGETTISKAYLWLLRSGRRDNPTRKHLQALAEFFGVAPAYFFDAATAAQVRAELEVLQLMRDVQARKIALRAVGLSERSQQAVVEMLERVRELEGLAEDDGDTR